MERSPQRLILEAKTRVIEAMALVTMAMANMPDQQSPQAADCEGAVKDLLSAKTFLEKAVNPTNTVAAKL
ncbi:MAG: hypothetical protein Q7S31_01290 [bacterium]|nr:hypothetical protein [bacterium]